MRDKAQEKQIPADYAKNDRVMKTAGPAKCHNNTSHMI